MLNKLANSPFAVHIYPPFQKGNDWYGTAVIQVGDHEVKLMASASEALLRTAYDLAAKHITVDDTGVTISGCQGCSPAMPTTFVGKLAALMPYMPTDGLAPHALQAAHLLYRASQGCEQCVDRINTINEQAASGDENAVEAKTIINGVLQLALVRQKAVERVARMGPTEFHSFLQRLQ